MACNRLTQDIALCKYSFLSKMSGNEHKEIPKKICKNMFIIDLDVKP